MMSFKVGDIIMLNDQHTHKRVGFIKEILGSGKYPIVVQFFEKHPNATSATSYDDYNVSYNEIVKVS